MKKEEIEKLLAIITVTYRETAKIDRNAAELNVNLWLETFIDEQADKVFAAAAMFMENPGQHPPTRGDVKDQVKMLDRLINNGRLTVKEYMGKSAYERLPVKTKAYIERVERIRNDLHAALPDPEKKTDNKTQEERDKEAAYWIGKIMALISDSEQPFIKYNKIAR